MIEEWIKKYDLKFVEMSTLTQVGVKECKEMACEKILAIKQEILNNTTRESGQGSTFRKIMKIEDNYLEGMYVSQPKKRD